MITEHWIDQIARTLKVTPEEVREANMYEEKDATHYGQILDGCQVRPCWDHVSPHPPPPCPILTHIPTHSVRSELKAVVHVHGLACFVLTDRMLHLLAKADICKVA